MLEDFSTAKDIAYGLKGIKAPPLDEYIAELKAKAAESQAITQWLADNADYIQEVHGSTTQHAFFPDDLRMGGDQDLTWKAGRAIYHQQRQQNSQMS